MTFMKKILLALTAALICISAAAQEVNEVPQFMWYYKGNVLLSSYSGSFDADDCQAFKAPKWKEVKGISDPVKEEPEPVMKPEWTTNPTLSPDKKFVAFTRDGDLYVAPYEGKGETRLTFDGSKTVYNGYASWVYYEEIFGRPSKYRAFWWSPDSRKIAFYRFDDTKVPLFPIYSPKGQDGELRETHYPKAGETNPEVKIGIIDLDNIFAGIVWVDFDPIEDQYFGTPFWSKDSRTLFVAREPRIQRSIDLYSVNVADGSKKAIYHETYPTWVDWIENPYLDDKGIYMVRNCETGWDQAWFLSYDGSVCKRLTDGPNWRMKIVRVEKDGTLFFTAERDSRYSESLYKATPKGEIVSISDPERSVLSTDFSRDGRYVLCFEQGMNIVPQAWVYDTRKPANCKKMWDMAGPDFDWSVLAKGKVVTIENDGFTIPGIIYYPFDFDPSKKYPVHVDIYGGPDTPMVRNRQLNVDDYWYLTNGIIEVIADCRASGHNGRAGLDMIYKHLNTVEVQDFIAWARYLQSLPYVNGDKIGVEGFSFGGTMTAMLVMTAPDAYHYGIAGGGVYDWMLYDSHYTERFMSTPEDNPEGYRDSRVINSAGKYKVRPGSNGSVMLKLTHGTGDDNVHFQNTLQLIDALQKTGADFDFMIYPDGMHGYRGYQGRHFDEANHAFWLKYLKD